MTFKKFKGGWEMSWGFYIIFAWTTLSIMHHCTGVVIRCIGQRPFEITANSLREWEERRVEPIFLSGATIVSSFTSYLDGRMMIYASDVSPFVTFSPQVWAPSRCKNSLPQDKVLKLDILQFSLS